MRSAIFSLCRKIEEWVRSVAFQWFLLQTAHSIGARTCFSLESVFFHHHNFEKISLFQASLYSFTLLKHLIYLHQDLRLREQIELLFSHCPCFKKQAFINVHKSFSLIAEVQMMRLKLNYRCGKITSDIFSLLHKFPLQTKIFYK